MHIQLLKNKYNILFKIVINYSNIPFKGRTTILFLEMVSSNSNLSESQRLFIHFMYKYVTYLFRISRAVTHKT